MTGIVMRYAAQSDVGLTRSNNQDSGYAGPNLLVVADGMGGHAGGDVASAVCIAHVATLDDEMPALDDAEESIETVVADAHAELLARVDENPDLAGLGTTMTALLKSGDILTLAHIGDSRAYLLRDGELTQVTKDHTFVQHLVETGRLAPEQAEHHPQRSLLLRVLGDVDLGMGLDFATEQAVPGDRWLLCSDGLSGVVSADTIEATLLAAETPDEAVDTLVTLALRGGGPDNITAICGEVLDEDDEDECPPDTTPIVVGSASIERDKPTAGGGGASEGAAALLDQADAGPDGEEDDGAPDDAAPVSRRRRLLPALIAGLAVIVLAATGYLAYSWSQTQYYVGADAGEVVIYQGIDQKIGPIRLSHVAERVGVDVDALPDFVQDRIRATMSATSLPEAQSIVTTLLDVGRATEPVEPVITPTPTRTPSSTPTATPTRAATSSPSKSPKPTNSPTTTPTAKSTPKSTASRTGGTG